MGNKERNTERVSKTAGGVLQDNVERLRGLFPECVTEGKIDFDKLRETLGGEIDDRPERYSFSWAGKRDAIKILQTPSRATLKPCPEESLDWDTTKNIFIEGENLEALKLLYKSYFGRVKMIYIDPPYNTGNDFIYPDNYADPLDTYLKLTGQKDAEGNLLRSNPETSGRYHSAWLSMMYPRLFIARQLLRDDGVIFVSIDDHEVHNLRMLMNEIFGEENFVAEIVWHRSYSPQMDAQGFSSAHDYILAYARSQEVTLNHEYFQQNESQFTYVDQKSGRKYRRRSLRKEGGNSLRSDAPSAWFALEAPDGTLVYPYKPLRKGETKRVEGVWRWSKETYATRSVEGLVEWVRNDADGWQPYAKQFIDEGASKPPITLWSYTEVGHTHEAAEEVAELVGSRLFDTPKPVRLLQKMLRLTTRSDEEAIVLDFFSGSCTTAHSVLALNREDGGNRRFIMVQLPEPTGREDYPTIADIGKERIRRVIAKLKKENEGKLKLDDGEQPEDLGFRVFKLDESTFRQWKGDGLTDADEYVKQMELFTDPLVPGWEKTPEDVIYEVAVKEGYSLSARIEKSSVAGKTIYTVTDAEKNQSFRICLESKLTMSVIKALNLQKTNLFICRDVALDDELAANLALQCRVKTI